MIQAKQMACSEEEIVQAYHEHCIRELLREFCSSVIQQMSHGELEFQKTAALDIAASILPYGKQAELKE